MNSPETIARYLLKSVRRAVREFGLIEDGDRIAVGVSGGKDSRALLDLLARGLNIPERYEIVAVHVDGSGQGLPDLRPRLEPWLQALGVPYEFAPLTLAAAEPLPLTCFRCTWQRRKALFLTAEQLSCNKIAYGHHADDAAITTLLSLFYKGQLESLEPRRDFFGERFTLIRPLIYTPEVDIRRYTRACGWNFPPELECPRRDAARRDAIERFLRTFDKREREQIRANLRRLTHPKQI